VRSVAAIAFILALVPIRVVAASALESVIAPLATLGTTQASHVSGSEAQGTSASEVLPGNGTRAGYVLGHGSVIPGSEWVSVGARHARRNVDYTIDYSSGSIFFAEPVSSMESIRVDYRYAESGTGGRSVAGASAVPLRFGNSLQLNLTYSYKAGSLIQGFTTPDVLTYGLASTTKVGSTSTISSMMYVATPQAKKRLSLNGVPVKQQAVNTVKEDRLMVQNADLAMGKVRLKLGFQDVGKDFAGFSALRDSNAAAPDVLNQLEKEKGLRRISMSAEVPSNSSRISFGMDRVRDDADDITSRAFAYTGGLFKFDFFVRDVGAGFSRFKDLREADAAQMANETGMTRTSYGMQFVTAGRGTSTPLWSGFRVTQLEADGTKLDYRTADIDLGNVKVTADMRTADSGFNRMAALNDAERTRMALIARQQFDPKAQVFQVTAEDKAKINNEVGLNRKNCSVRINSGEVDTWLSLGTVDSGSAGISRSLFEINGKKFTFKVQQHSIDNNFFRISSLQPTEIINYGNEHGMSRTVFESTLKLAGGSAALRQATVTDDIGAKIIRRKVDFVNKRVDLHANFQDIDPRFARIADLSDSDRNVLATERGFSRADYLIGIQATDSLKMQTYIYDSTNVTAGQTRSQNKHEIVYKPTNGPQITALRDNYSYISQAGNLSSYSRSKITFDKKLSLIGGLLFQGLSDVNTVREGNGLPVTTTISQAHLESDQKARSAFALDILNIDYGNGSYENTQGVSVKNKASNKADIVASVAHTTREANKSEDNVSVGVDWAVNKDLTLRTSVANRDGGPKGSQQAHQFSLNGLIAKRLLGFNDVKVGSSADSTTLTGKRIGFSNALKIEAGFHGGTFLLDNSDKLNPANGIYYGSRIVRFISSNDDKNWYHFSLLRQRVTTPQGATAEKHDYILTLSVNPEVRVEVKSFFGKDAQDGSITPVGGAILKVSRAFSPDTTSYVNYVKDKNRLTLRSAEVMGVGFVRKISDKNALELYFGVGKLNEPSGTRSNNVFKLMYDRKLDANRYLSISAEKKSGVDQSLINPLEGDTTARIDFRTVFH
jgi:hypothetical protein